MQVNKRRKRNFQFPVWLGTPGNMKRICESKAFYRAFNAIFGKVGCLATEDVIIQLLRTKCLPVLYYGLEACPVTKAQTKSLDYALRSCFSKIFSTRDQVVVHHCMVFLISLLFLKL